MHILWTPSWYPSADFPFNGSFFAEQVEMLRTAGYQVRVVCLEPIWRGQKDQSVRSPLAEAEVAQPAETMFRGSFHPVMGGLLPGDKHRIRKLLLPWAKGYQAEYGKPEVIHAHSVFPGIIMAQVLAEYWGIGYGVTEHRPSTLDAAAWRPRTRTITKAVRQADFRLSVSHRMNQLLAKKYQSEAFEISYLPVMGTFFQTELPTAGGAIKLLHVSHLDENKRPKMTIAAFARAQSVEPRLTLGIAGGSAERIRELKTFAESLGVGEQVTFYGLQARADLPELYANHHALVLASDVEAGGTVISEALSTGIPAICTNTFAGASAIEPKLGYLVPVGAEEALAKAMTDFALRHDFWLGQAEQIRQVAKQRYSADAFTAALSQVYTQAKR